jgi:TatD DNase family protein
MKLVDTHTHIFGPDFYADLSETVERANQRGIVRMLLPNIDANSVSDVRKACNEFPSLKPMWGLHPCHVFAKWKEELDGLKPLFDSDPACAVGEIGLDLYWSREFESEQKQALEIQLGWALERNLPVSLHTREATRETIDLVKPFAEKGLRGVFHCFSGTKEEAEEIIRLGFFLGIGGSITYKKNPVRDFISEIPMDSLVLETDAPYLPPVPYRGKRNEPAYLQEVAFALSDLTQINPKTIAEITTKNAISLFALDL